LIKVLSIFGTRPEAVKMAPVVKQLEAHPQVESRVCVTAQHRQMLDQVLDLFAIHPDVDLNLMRENQSLAGLTSEILVHLEPVLKKENPDWVLVQGDTTTVMTTALLCYYNRIKVGHVEAGLRTGDKWQPFPEEVNRKIAGAVADLHFAPTQHSRQNLLREGVPADSIVVTGNTVIDALQEITRRPAPEHIANLLLEKGVSPGMKQLVLVTAHRRENFGQPIQEICEALKTLAARYENQIEIVYPVHLNPNIKNVVQAALGEVRNITLLPPLDYLPLVHLMKNSKLVLTDSGGIQEEATSMGIPTLVLREVTERPEGVEAGVLRLVGTDKNRIVSETSRLLENEEAYAAMSQAKNPFGDGRAAQRIVEAIVERG
jgi:UDP-N-acetylglucosamine 2-epimerase (non-hydrolysing)